MFGLAVAARRDVVGQHLEVIRDDQVVLFIRPGTVRHCARLWARSLFVIRDFWQGPGSPRTPPSDLGIGRHGAVLLAALRLRVGLRHRMISRTGRTHERGNPLEIRGCFTPSRRHRGALEERHGPFGDPFFGKRPVSEGRMALPTPFETKRKKASIGAPGRIQYLNVAERQGFEPWRRFPAYTLSRRAPSTTRPPLRWRSNTDAARARQEGGGASIAGRGCRFRTERADHRPEDIVHAYHVYGYKRPQRWYARVELRTTRWASISSRPGARGRFSVNAAISRCAAKRPRRTRGWWIVVSAGM